ncbi:MAG: ATP synthase F1 subunit epsilon [Parcubacteria group bacterium]|nr:ATP synthase F1 subunit epsilon [Parcubacteria group bacterium]|tara:strand:- start:2164 stop:2577 length:414 start_codon:yes stop_codon:yes gene_type:complete
MLTYEITTPEEKLEEGEATSISLPTSDGEITILPHHIPLISTLGAGEIIIRKDKEEFYYATEGGFLEVRQGGYVAIMADFTARAESLDEEIIEKAKAQAEEYIKTQKFEDDEQFAAAAAAIERELAKLKVVRKRRRR